jgi:hypothetical protein
MLAAMLSNNATWQVLVPTLHLITAHPAAFDPWRAATNHSFAFGPLSGGSIWFRKVA